MQQEITCRKGF